MYSKRYDTREYWKDEAIEKTRQLKELIDQRLVFKEKILAKEDELKNSLKENELIRFELRKENDALKKLINNNEVLNKSLINKEEELLESVEENKLTKGHKMLVLQFLNTLESVNTLDIPQKNKIKLLAKIIGGHEKNIEKDFNGRGFQIDSPLSTLSNYNFMEKICEELEIKEWQSKIEEMLDKIKKAKNFK